MYWTDFIIPAIFCLGLLVSIVYENNKAPQDSRYNLGTIERKR